MNWVNVEKDILHKYCGDCEDEVPNEQCDRCTIAKQYLSIVSGDAEREREPFAPTVHHNPIWEQMTERQKRQWLWYTERNIAAGDVRGVELEEVMPSVDEKLSGWEFEGSAGGDEDSGAGAGGGPRIFGHFGKIVALSGFGFCLGVILAVLGLDNGYFIREVYTNIGAVQAVTYQPDYFLAWLSIMGLALVGFAIGWIWESLTCST